MTYAQQAQLGSEGRDPLRTCGNTSLRACFPEVQQGQVSEILSREAMIDRILMDLYGLARSHSFDSRALEQHVKEALSGGSGMWYTGEREQLLQIHAEVPHADSTT